MTRVSQRSLAFAAFLLSPAFAATPPPEPPQTEISWNQKSKAKPITRLLMGSLDVRFNETTLETVRGAAGSGAISHQGDASESIYWLCYTTSRERIWIIAHGEMGGPEHAVTEVAAQALEQSRASKDCPALPKSLQPVSLNRDLWLGLSEIMAQEKLGSPSYMEGPWQAFNFHGTEPGECLPDGYDVLNWLWLKTEKGRLITIHAGQITSC